VAGSGENPHLASCHFAGQLNLEGVSGVRPPDSPEGR
jgi:hypothetical protein